MAALRQEQHNPARDAELNLLQQDNGTLKVRWHQCRSVALQSCPSIARRACLFASSLERFHTATSPHPHPHLAYPALDLLRRRRRSWPLWLLSMRAGPRWQPIMLGVRRRRDTRRSWQRCGRSMQGSGKWPGLCCQHAEVARGDARAFTLAPHGIFLSAIHWHIAGTSVLRCGRALRGCRWSTRRTCRRH